MKEALEALKIFVVQRVVDIFFEVNAEFFFREMHFAGGLGGDLGDLGQAVIAGGLEVSGNVGYMHVFYFLWIGEIGASGPDGQDGGELGQAAPFFDDVVDVEGAAMGNDGSCEPFAIGPEGDAAGFGDDGDS